MIDTSFECRLALSELRRVVQRLALVSHAPAQTVNLAPPPEGLRAPVRWRVWPNRPADAHVGGRSRGGGDSSLPRGGVDWRGDKTEEYRQKSHVYFQRRLDAMERSDRLYTASDLSALHREAREALLAWMKTPDVSGVKDLEPEPKSFLWKCQIADDDRPVETVKTHYSVSRATIYRYRSKYRGLRRGFVA